MRSFFTEPENISGNTVVLTEDAAHIKKVLRMKVGDKILVFDGSGRELTCEISEIQDSGIACSILSESFSESEPEIKVTVFQGIPKSDKMEQIIQKCVELGVYRIVPVRTDRAVAKVNGTEKIKRWNKISREAVKQCGRGLVPEVTEPVSFKEAVASLKELELAVMPYEVLGHGGEKGLKELLVKNKGVKNIGIIIGPEGGFSDSEALFAQESGISAVGIGRRILRTETVASTLLSVIMYENDEF